MKLIKTFRHGYADSGIFQLGSSVTTTVFAADGSDVMTNAEVRKVDKETKKITSSTKTSKASICPA